MPELPDSDAVLAQFNRLTKGLFEGNSRRNAFQPWEMDILLDMVMCDLGTASKVGILRQYQKAVQRRMEKGARLPLKLSEYLESLKTKRTARILPRPLVSSNSALTAKPRKVGGFECVRNSKHRTLAELRRRRHARNDRRPRKLFG